MPWSIFTQGGGDPAAATWAQDLLQQASQEWGINVDTSGNEQFIFDWEKSEGGGGANNPLNQGPDPNDPSLTSTGQQYGGGAADYVSTTAGLKGSLDYLDMPAYSNVKLALEQNNPNAAAEGLWASPWAKSHYGYGANWNTSPFPGQSGPVVEYTTTAGKGAGSPAASLDPLNTFGTLGRVLAYIDGFLNPKVTAVHGIADLFGATNATLSAIATLVDRAVVVLIGTGFVYIGIKGLFGGGLRVVGAVQRQEEIGLARARNARLTAGRPLIVPQGATVVPPTGEPYGFG